MDKIEFEDRLVNLQEHLNKQITRNFENIIKFEEDSDYLAMIILHLFALCVVLSTIIFWLVMF